MPSHEKFITVSVSTRKFWKLYLPLAMALSVIAVFAGIFFVDEFVMPRIVGINRGMVEVPAVTGLQLEDGREKLFAVGLLTEIKGREYDGTVPENAIVSQMPGRGEKVKKGRRILVVVSRGGEFAAIPDIKNLTEFQARNELKKNGFQVGEVRKTFHDRQPAEQVINAVPPCGATISRNMKVDLVISKGPKPTSAEMPTIVGEKIADARRKMEESGLKIGKVLYKNAPSLLPGTVISQSVPPGNPVPLERPVDITVSVVQ